MGKKWMLLAMMAAVLLLGGDVRNARAMATSCNSDLLNCYEAAARIDSFWYRWAAGMDCEFTYVECARRALVGY